VVEELPKAIDGVSEMDIAIKVESASNFFMAPSLWSRSLGLIRQELNVCRTNFWQNAQVKKIALLLSTLLISGCATSQNSISESISQQDVTAISINENPTFSVSRVVVLANGVAEIMFALNAKSILVGRDISSTENSLQDVPIVTSGHQVISEKVIALKPDLVIIDASTGPKAAIAQIRSAKITVVQTPESWSLDDIPSKVLAVGSAIGAPVSAQLLVDKLTNQKTINQVKGEPKIAFLYLRGTSAVYLIGGPGSGADSLIEAIGGVDVGAQNLPRAFNTLTAESLAQLNPDVLLVMTKGLESVGGIEGLVKLPGVAQSVAGKRKAIISVDDSLLLSFGPRSYSLLQQMALSVDRVSS
jgi:iron complex transport system substrate-binding protein